MTTSQSRFRLPVMGRRGALLAAAGAVVVLMMVAAGNHAMPLFGTGVEPPPQTEFGLGPRASAGGVYRAVLRPAERLGYRRMHAAQLVVHTRAGEPAGNASIQVDGGMPQHGHGLPTAPRVTRNLGNGAYQVSGLRFNMPGWWVLKFRIESAAGTDSVTFNLAL